MNPHAKKTLSKSLEACATGKCFRLLPMASASHLRLVTNPGIFASAAAISKGIDLIDSLLAVPEVDIPEPGNAWPLLRQWCRDKNLQADMLPDAWLAAAVVQLGDPPVTFDSAFKKLLRRQQFTLLAAT